MTSTLTDTCPATDQAVVAIYRSHAEAAVRCLAADGLPTGSISIIGRNFEPNDIQGFYRPSDAAVYGADHAVWFGGIFGRMLGAMGFFVFPMVGALMVMGPLSTMIAGAIAGAGAGALVHGLVIAGIPEGIAFEYQTHLQTGEFLVIVHGNSGMVSRANDVLETTSHTRVQAYGMPHILAKKTEQVSQ